jgi:hypothetical protein
VGFALIFFSPVGVLARQVLATVTSTFIPPSPSPTPFDVSCPVGTPAGWGTYTPSPLWSVECGACAVIVTPTSTMTASPVPTWSGTGTPPATASPTASPTVSPTASPIPEGGMGCIQDANSICTSLDGGKHLHWEWDLYNNDYHPAVVLRYALPSYSWLGRTGRLIVNGQVSILDDSNILNNYEKKYRYFSNGISEQWYVIVSGNTYDISIDTPATFLGTYYLTVAVQFYNEYADYASTKGFADLYAPYVSPPVSTPTPTPLPPFDIGYCSSIAPPLSDFGFDLFVPDGEPYCELGWEAFKAGSVTMPKVKICFQPSAFGVITLFSYDYEVGTLGLAIAAAFIWRFMRTV